MTDPDKHSPHSAASATGESAKSARARRRRAEDRAREMAAQFPENLKTLSRNEIQRTLHELRVSQIELELKNESLLQMQRALQKSESHLRLCQIGGGIGSWEIDLINKKQNWSVNNNALLGFSDQDKLTWENFQSAVHPEDIQRVIDAKRSHIEQGTKYDVEYRIVAADGTARWVRSAGQVELDASGKAVLMRGVTQDITERKRGEKALQASESLLRAIIENEPECIKIVDSQGCLSQINPAGLAMLEADSLEQVIGHPVLDIITPEYRNAFVNMHNRVLAGEAMQMEFEVIGLKGKHRWLETHAVPMQDNGKTVQLAVTRDITERKQAEVALQESNESLAEAQLIAGLGSYVLDIPSGCWKSSSVLNKLLGIGEAYERTVEGWQALIHPDDFAIVGNYFNNEVLGQGKTFDKEYRIIRHSDQSTRWVHGLGRPEFDSQGQLQKMTGTIQDITERKLIEQELQRTQQELRGLSKAANEALEAERRRTARDLHDELGQLLVAVKMYLGSLCSVLPQNDPNTGLLTKDMHTILDMSIMATRRIASDLRPTILDDMGLAAALEWLTHNFSRQTGIEANLVCGNTAAHVPEPITSALYRITQESLTNVTKHAHATKVEIGLELDGDGIQLIIRDNGKGIEAADQNKPGAFGLIGIRERVVLLSGKATINGNPDRGTEVRVCIPLSAVPIQ